MKEIFEVWLGVFFLAVLMVGGMSIISAGIDARNADASKTNYIAEIEDSNFAASVLSAVMTDAESNGYGMTVDLYHQDMSGARTTTTGLTSASALPDTTDVYMARVSMDVDYSFPMFNTITDHTLIGYAR